MLYKKFTHGSPGKSFLWLLVSLITAIVLAFSMGVRGASAEMMEPPDYPPSTEPEEPGFEPFTSGFEWSVPNRFGRDDNMDGIIDYHYDSATYQYEKSLLYPESWPMIFDGCRTEQDAETGISSTNTYRWVLNGETIQGNQCKFTYAKNSPMAGNLGFTAQGTYPVDLTVTYGEGITSPSGQNPETFHQEVVVRDILIVSLGDSYASGEGVPDISQRWHIEWGFPVWDADAVWQDKRCHRSAKAGPALAALAIERMDPKTSVTFISYACSGATIGTELFDGSGGGDPNQSRGVGMLEPYKGQEVSEPYNYSSRAEGWVGYIPSQIGQLKNVLIPPQGKLQRQIDSLIISGGGNDMLFAKLLANCVLWEFCWTLPTMLERPSDWTLYTPQQIVLRANEIIPGREGVDSVQTNYERLATEIGQINPGPLNVYLTQYPDLSSASDGQYCRMLDDIGWPNPFLAMEPWEAQAAEQDGLRNLNKTIFSEAYDRRSQGWVYVDGLARYNLTDTDPNGPAGLFYKHGYCAIENWITRAEESELRQGPLYWRAGTTGTAHPNYSGNLAISQRLLYYMLPNLFPQPPANPPAISAPAYAINDLVSESGANGWYIGSCQAGACYPKVAVQVVGTAEAGVAGAGVTIEGVDACTVPGVMCRKDGGLSADKKQYTWNIELIADGIYNLQFNLRDSAGAIANGGSGIKVDLHDPALVTPGPFTVNEGGTVMLEAAVSDNEGSPVSYTWDLDNDGSFETFVQKPEFSAVSQDGPASLTIKVKATDQAGRTATSNAVINVANVAPEVEITDLQASNPEGTAISLSSAVSDPGANDTFTYGWSVSQAGTVLATGANSTFSFTPEDNGAYVVSLKVTDDDGGEGSASQTIQASNVAPVLSNMQYNPMSVNEGGSLTVSGSLSDPGAKDSLSLAINWGDGSAEETQSLVMGTTSFNVSHTYTDDNPGGTASDSPTITVKVTDKDQAGDTKTSTITVHNLPPSVILTGPADGALYKINDPVNVTATVTDPSTIDSLSCMVNWGDGSHSAGTLMAGGCSASHTFMAAGVYTIQLMATDDDTGSDTKSVMVVVYDPSAGFVTGGGWIISPAGAYKADESLTGKATFGFVSKYQKGASLPTGNTAFQFDLAGLSFASQSYEWLVVNQAGTNAQFKGSGWINGLAGPNGNAYKFMLWAGDGSPDTFRIRIWWEDAAGEYAVYDNGVAQAIGAGNIVVHTGK